MPRKVVLYIAVSADGYIAKPNDDLSFLQAVAVENEDYGYKAFMDTIDTVILGRKTFDWVFKEIGSVPHPELDTYVITRTARPDIGKTRFYTGDLIALVNRLKQEPGNNIFCDGGAEVIHTLLRHHLIDEMILSVIPVMVGEGIRLFKDGRPEQPLSLLDTRSYTSGLVQLHYRFTAPE